MKTKFASYCLNNLPEGCKYCVRGEKLVLFISGKCSRACWYCSLSDKRKNSEKIWANEREIHNVKELLEEAEESKATSAGITGGDPLLFLDRTLEYARALKEKFGEKFHIHVYLPTKLVSLHNLTQIEEFVDEVRFHPEFLINPDKIYEDSEKSEDSLTLSQKRFAQDIEKIKMAERVFGKQNVGIELPMIPNKHEEIKKFIFKVKDYISFVNLNEFEMSETNCEQVEKNYELGEGGYVIKGSLEEGKRLLNELAREHIKLNIHLCSAELKNWHQYKNRLLRHKILPGGVRQEDGTVVYLVVPGMYSGGWYDEKKKRTIISEKEAKELKGKIKVYRVEEYPTYDGDEVEREEL